ncbi:hypothetical protein V2J09_002914 [Rumex salicifolius]
MKMAHPVSLQLPNHSSPSLLLRSPSCINPSFGRQFRLPVYSLTTKIRASSVSAVEIQKPASSEIDSVISEQAERLACPVCYEPLVRKGPSGLNLDAIYRSGFMCKRCSKTYSSKNIYLDLTVTAGSVEYTENKPSSTELFRYEFLLVIVSSVCNYRLSMSPLVSFLYERGWRQNFNQSGFPGLEEEFKMAQEYFKSVEGGLLVDVSCGSGLFSRKFANSGSYSGVIALDFSENMLRQCYDFIKKEDVMLSKNLALVRADVSRLPFPSASVDAIHAGAALHCWPSPSNAVAEVTRVLRSGGVFVGTTFLRYTSSTPAIIRPLRERFAQNYNYLTEEEIKDLCLSCGLINYSVKVQQSFIMFSGQKP